MPTIKINEWLQDDIKEFVKTKLLNDLLIENKIAEEERHNYYLHNSEGGYGHEAPANPSYGSFTWHVANYKKRGKCSGNITITVRDALKLYLSNEE